jgi:hypothetical protein
MLFLPHLQGPGAGAAGCGLLGGAADRSEVSQPRAEPVLASAMPPGMRHALRMRRKLKLRGHRGFRQANT